MEMSQDQKDALANGRVEARAIKAYLKALEAPKSGRPATRESLNKRLAQVDAKVDDSDDPLKTIELIQKRLEIQEALTQVDDHEDFDSLESGFVDTAQSYSVRKGISYTAWREFGVPATILRRAGVPETRRR